MDDLDPSAGSPTLNNGAEPQGNDDPQDPLRPEAEEASGHTPRLAEPTEDTETFDDDEAPETTAAQDDDEEANGRDSDVDDDSELEELDENEFDEFDANALNIPDKPLQVDADNVGLLGVHKRKRTDEEERERKKKKKEGRRDKPKRPRKNREEDEVDFQGGPEMEGRRARKEGGKSAPRRARTPENEDNLSPEERKFAANCGETKMFVLIFAIQAVDVHLTARWTRRSKATARHAAARVLISTPWPTRKLRRCASVWLAPANKMPKPVLVARLQHTSSKFYLQSSSCSTRTPSRPNLWTQTPTFLRPYVSCSNQQITMPHSPNYRIQRELFAVLAKLNIGKEALIASGIGKVVLFYTKSIQPQPEIKRQAEKLIGDWMRVVLKKDKAMRNKPVETRVYDPVASQVAARSKGTEIDRAAIAAEKRRRALAAPQPANRARVEGGLATYTIAPVNNLTSVAGLDRPQRMGDETFKRIAGKGAPKGKRL